MSGTSLIVATTALAGLAWFYRLDRYPLVVIGDDMLDEVAVHAKARAYVS